MTGEIDEMEKEIEQTRYQSHQLENDLLADPVRSNLVSFYADLLNLKEKKKHQDYEEGNKPEQEQDKPRYMTHIMTHAMTHNILE